MRNVWTKEPANEWNGMETKKQMNEQAWFDACVSVCASTMYIYVSVHEATSICGACVLVLLQNWTEHVAKQHRTHIHFIVAVVVVVIVKVMLVQMVWSLVAVLLLFSLLSLLVFVATIACLLGEECVWKKVSTRSSLCCCCWNETRQTRHMNCFICSNQISAQISIPSNNNTKWKRTQNSRKMTAKHTHTKGVHSF